MKILIAFALLFSTQLYAEDVVSSHYICTHKDNNHVREVKITHQYPGCQVIYIKANETNNIIKYFNNSYSMLIINFKSYH